MMIQTQHANGNAFLERGIRQNLMHAGQARQGPEGPEPLAWSYISCGRLSWVAEEGNVTQSRGPVRADTTISECPDQAP